MTLERILEAIAAACTICGIASNFMPQEWRATKVMTKLGALTFRAQTKEISKP
jgi:hypothetical protein